jgi:uncharacterized protein YdhG (YjbR/CyaY superfamily)
VQSAAASIDQYLKELPEDRRAPMKELYTTISKNIPKGFQDGMGYGMIGWVVPHSIYPAGYHCDPKQPLPFVSIASQKNFIAVYHMGMYAMPEVLNWFTGEFPKHSKAKLNMGKSCIRFKKPADIPYALIAELVKKITVKDCIVMYEANIKR